MDKIVGKYGTFFIISVFSAIYIESFCEMRAAYLMSDYKGILTNEFSFQLFLKLVFLFLLSFCLLILIRRFQHLLEYLEKNRYLIGLGVIIIFTLLEISGSSIGMYYTILSHSFKDKTELFSQGVLWGIPRAIRGDEWATLTPLNFSQEYNSYDSISQVIRGTDTDVTTFYANPCFSIATIFRPFYWGYLLFGSAKGLAFYWNSRLVCLFLASYEFGKVITSRNKILSITFAVLITFSQTIQWWYSTNGLIEMFIFGEFAVVLIQLFPQDSPTWKKSLICLGLIECAGGFLLTYYPAHQIPLAYVFFTIALYVVIQNRKLFKKKDILYIAGIIAFFSAIILLILKNSSEAIQSTINTVYPGNRISTGGTESFAKLFYWIINIFTPIDDNGLIVNGNVVESSTFYSLFPFGIMCSIYSMIRNKKLDLFSILLLIIEIVFITYCIIGFPAILAKITLLNYSVSSRTLEVISYIEIILLFHFMSNNTTINEESKPFRIVVTLFSTIIVLVEILVLFSHGYRPIIIIWILSLIISVYLIFLIIRNTKVHQQKLSITIIAIVLISGLCVNPIQKGDDVIFDNNIVKSIKEISSTNSDALWIVSSERAVLNNIPITVGAKTINSTNTYPNISTWEKIDPNKQYSDIYNRYAHITFEVTNSETNFELLYPDAFRININNNDLYSLNIKYIFSDHELQYNNIRPIKYIDSFYIYEIY